MRRWVSVLFALAAAGAQAQTIRVPPVRTVATLGTATAHRLVIVTDGTSAADCATGGGSTAALCMATGAAWVAVPLATASGTVSSVAVAVPSEWSVSGSPVTTSGTITIAEATQTANTVYAGPTTGGAAAPGFRSLVSADIPNNAANTSGNAGTATALAANGGNCSAGSYPLGVDASGAVESCTAVTADPTLAGDVDGLSSANDIDEVSVESELESVLDLQDLQGAVTDAQVPDGITVSLAATATALAANGANCSAGNYPLGVDASGAVESCTAAGDVAGPSSSVDDDIALFSGTTGKVIKKTTASGYGTFSGGTYRGAGAQYKNGTVFLTHQGFGDYDNPTLALSGASVPDVRGGSGSIIGGAVNLYLGAILFTSSANAVNSHNVMIANEYDGEIGIGSPNAAFDPKALSTGGLKTGVVTKTADYTVTADDYTLRCDATSGAVTFTLPTIAAQTRRRIYRLIKVDSGGNACAFARSSSDTINGATSASTSTQYASIEVQSPDTGSDWMKF